MPKEDDQHCPISAEVGLQNPKKTLWNPQGFVSDAG
jgi:hypothetical protein